MGAKSCSRLTKVGASVLGKGIALYIAGFPDSSGKKGITGGAIGGAIWGGGIASTVRTIGEVGWPNVVLACAANEEELVC